MANTVKKYHPVNAHLFYRFCHYFYFQLQLLGLPEATDDLAL